MNLLNLSINRIIIHQVYERDDEGKRVEPLRTHELTNFEASAMAAFKSRVVDALGDGSKAVPLEIVNQETEDLPTLVDRIILESDEEFIVSSYDFATKLAQAQHSKRIPGGILVVFTGTFGSPVKNFLGIIKAEVHSGYEKNVNEKNGEISLKFVREVLLTPGTRLYKTAAFYEKPEIETHSADLNDKWGVLVSDSQINKADGKAAARYFYADFLGCGYPQTSARTTKNFYDSTSEFIEQLDWPIEDKNDLTNALNTYLKVDKSPTIGTEDFAEKYIKDEDVKSDFKEFMEDSGVPSTAFTKDIEHIKGKLKNRRISFSKNLKITGPSEIFKELVQIETIDGELNGSGSPQEWTRVTIKDKITAVQE